MKMHWCDGGERKEEAVKVVIKAGQGGRKGYGD